MANQNSQERLDDIEDEFRRAVFLAVYQSRQQRMRRVTAMLVLLLKYLLRGLIILWPIYVVFLAVLVFPNVRQYLWYFLVLLPGLFIWIIIYLKGARLEYKSYVTGFILENGFIKQLFLQ